jgi:hypothetical protein
MGAATRVTNGHRAAVCGLILAGVSYGTACQIAAAPRERMRQYVPPDYRRSPMPVRVREMTRPQYAVYRKLVPVLGRNRAVEQALALP